VICHDEDDLLKVYCVMLKNHFNALTIDSGKAYIEKQMEYALGGKKVVMLLLDIGSATFGVTKLPER
jgi:hypothetical protein